MVAAKNDAAHLSLSAQLTGRSMGRFYKAICLGTVKKDKFSVNLPIGRHPVDRQKMAVRPKQGRNAITFITVLERLPAHQPRFTLIEARLETGRTHQIRVHMASAGHPVKGDAVYGASRETGGQILHAKKIIFVHPRSAEEIIIETEWPQYFIEAIASVS
jgi:23S rRNA pseudouridine1911/1915/1917 synthase